MRRTTFVLMLLVLTLALAYGVQGALTHPATSHRATDATIVKDQTTCTTAPAGTTSVAGATWKA